MRFDSEFGSFHRDYERVADGIRVTTRVEIPGRDVAIADVAVFNRLLDSIYRNSNIRFGLAPGRAGD